MRGLLRIRNSNMTENTGEVKQSTMRSPIGMRGMAARAVRFTEDIRIPYKPIILHWNKLIVPWFSVFFLHLFNRLMPPKITICMKPLIKSTSPALSFVQLTT